MPSMDELLNLIGLTLEEAGATLATLQLVATVEEDLQEGEAPRYWLQSKPGGFDIKHTSDGYITTVFIYVGGDENHRPFMGELAYGLSKSSSASEVRTVLGAPSWSRPNVKIPVLGNYGPADRYDCRGISVHYEYSLDGQRIKLITGMSPNEVPRG